MRFLFFHLAKILFCAVGWVRFSFFLFPSFLENKTTDKKKRDHLSRTKEEWKTDHPSDL